MKKTIALLLWITLASIGLRAVNASTSGPATTTEVTLGHSVVALTGPWKFHIGDDPQWADPNFDDSGWETVSLNTKKGSIDPIMGFAGFVPGWTAKGHPGYSGFAWYRIRVRITGADEPLAFLGPSSFDDSYQLFVNGHWIGSFGDFDRPVPTVYTDRSVRFALPREIVQSRPDGTTVIAVRFFMAPRTLLQTDDPGGFHAPPVIGFANAIAAAYHVGWEEQYRAVSSLVAEIAWSLIFAILILMLYVFDRTEIILLWPFSACMLGALTWLLLFLEVTTKLMTALQEAVAFAVTLELWQGLWLMTFWAYFGLQQKKWLRNAIAVLVLWRIFAGVLFQILLLGGKVSHSVFAAEAIDVFVANAVALLLAIAITWMGWRRPQPEHWTLFLALFLFAVPYLIPELRLLHIPAQWFLFGVPLRLTTICDFVSLVFFSFVLLRHFRSSQRRQQAIEEDVKQAQEVQQVLIPEALPQVAGLTIESEYRPAREVGGDFFQIIPEPSDGSVLIVVGDVTGHGLQAGMLVALIVGAIRAEAAHSNDPLTALNALNQRLCGRGEAHATGLALRVGSDGAVTLANAGHLPPYLNGRELPMEGALPLGMMPTAKFSLMHFQLAPGDRLLLMSDGVVEAQDKDGQLFGFERVDTLLQRPITAAEIATAAQNFGQQDDILVLRITREASGVSRTPEEPALVMA
ncbi:MAG: SpoIIE family protein phosphatase [Acidobacteriaceae bacterium]